MNTADNPTTPNPQSSQPNDSAGLLDLFDLSLLWRRKWSLVCSFLVAGGLGAAYVRQETPIFEVTSRILVQMERFSTEKESLLRTDRTFLVTQGELVACPVVVQPALATLQKKPATDPPDHAATEAVIRSLRVTAVDDANVLKLTYRDSDPQEAVNVLRAVVNSYKKYVQDLQHGSIGETLNVLNQKELELRKELVNLQNEYAKLCKDSPVIGQGGEAYRNNVAMLEKRGTDLAAVQRQRVEKETKLQALVQALGLPADNQLTSAQLVPTVLQVYGDSESPVRGAAVIPAIVTSERLARQGAEDAGNSAGEFLDPIRVQDQLWQAETRAKELSQKYGPKHPDMRGILAQIAMWEQRLEASKRAAPLALAQELGALKQSETHLAEMYETEFQNVKLLDASLLQEQHARADLQRVQSIYDATAEQLRDIQLADKMLANGQVAIMVRVIEPPDETAKLVWPRPPQFIGLSAVLGLAVGCVLVTLAARVTGKR